MDALAGLLDGPRAQGAFLLRSVLDPPWSVRVEDEAPLTLVAMVRGTAWFLPHGADGGEPVALGPGDIAIARGPDPYTVADTPETAVQVVIKPGQVCLSPDGTKEFALAEFGVRSWGNAAEGTTCMVTGTYQLEGEISRRLLDALPPLVVIRDDERVSPLLPIFAQEVVKDEPGQEAVLDRLLDVILISALRAWFARPDAEVPAWYRANSDPVVGRALRALHGDPAYPWTVANLARAAGVSRAALARRFTELLGEPPMTYLTTWRLTLAADLLREPSATIGAVAEQVGYGSPFALSTAFKRVRGVSPKEFRALAVRA